MIYKRIDINRSAHNIVQKNRATHKCITRKFVFNSHLYYNSIIEKIQKLLQNLCIESTHLFT